MIVCAACGEAPRLDGRHSGYYTMICPCRSTVVDGATHDPLVGERWKFRPYPGMSVFMSPVMCRMNLAGVRWDLGGRPGFEEALAGAIGDIEAMRAVCRVIGS